MTLLIVALSAFRVQLCMLTVFLVKLTHSVTQHTNINTPTSANSSVTLFLLLHNQT